MKRLHVLHGVLLSILLMAGIVPTFADTHVWTGLGLTGNWSIPANWAANNPPAAGEASPNYIVFPAGATRLNNTNNIAGLVVDRLSFDGSGYHIHGSGNGTNLTFRGGYGNFGGNGTHTLGETLTITLTNVVQFYSGPTSNIRIRSRLVGAGGLKVAAVSVITLDGALPNTYSGTTTLTDGVLALARGYSLFGTWVPSVAVSGPLVVGDTNILAEPYVLEIYGGQIADTSHVTINPNGTLYLGGNDDTIGALTMTGGSLYGDSLETIVIGTLTLGGNVTAHYSPLLNAVITAKLNLGGVTRTVNVASNATFVISGAIADGGDGRFPIGLTKTGAGILMLAASSSTYDGTTLINAGSVEVSGNGALGATSGGTTVANGAQLILNSVVVGAEPLTLNGSGANGALVGIGTASIAGSITLASDACIFVNTGFTLTLGGTINGAGGLTKLGGGTLKFAGAGDNTYDGATQVQSGKLQLHQPFSTALPSDLQIGGGPASATVQSLTTGQFSAGRAVQIETNGLLDLNNFNASIGALSLNHGNASSGSGALTVFGNVTVPPGGDGAIHGQLTLGGATRQFNIGTNGGLGIYAAISNGGGPAGLTKNGPGLLALWNANTFSGPVTINSGWMQVDRAAGLGTGAGGVTVNTGGSLLLVSDPNWFVPDYVVSNIALTLNGTGFDGLGALVGVSSNGWAGPIHLASDSRVGGFYGGDYLELAGPVSGAGGLEIGGGTGSTVILSGNADNTLLGQVSVRGTNTLLLAKTGGATAIPSPLIIGTTNHVSDTSVVRLRASHQIGNTASVAVFRSGRLDLNGFNDTIGPLAFTSGTVGGAPGLLTLGGNVTINSDLYGGSVYCPLSLGGQTRTFGGDGYLQVNSPISDGGGNAGILKHGIGVLDLSAANTYSGPTTVTDGNLTVHHNQALGSTAQGTVVSNTGLIRIIGASVIGESLSLAGAGQSDAVLSAFATNVWSGPVTLANTVTFSLYNPTDRLSLSGVVGGPGGLVKEGSGTLAFSGAFANTFDGIFFANEGTTELAKNSGNDSVPGHLRVGRSDGSSANAVVRWLSDNQAQGPAFGSAAVTINPNGTLDLNNHNDVLGALNFHEGIVTTGTGTLTLGGSVYVEGIYNFLYGVVSLGGESRYFNVAPGSILASGARIEDGGAPSGLTVLGGGTVELRSDSTFSGPLIVDQSVVWVENDFALGNANGGTFVTNAATLVLYNVPVTGESLTINSPGRWGADSAPLVVAGTNSWSGPIELPADAHFSVYLTGAVLTVSGPISGPGGLLVEGNGTLRFTGTSPNTFAGPLTAAVGLLELAKPNAVSVYGPLELSSGKVRYGAAHQLLDTSAVTIQAAGTFDLNGFSDFIGDLNGWGAVNLGAGVLTVGGANSVNNFAGNISGAGGELDKIGGNALVLMGTNTYTSATLVKGGTLIVNGVQPSSDVYVQAGATLGGRGSIAKLYGQGGTISPGASPGPLTVNGNAILNAATTVRIEINGPNAGVDYDQLVNFGQLAANNATLQVVMGFVGAVSNQYVIVDHPIGLTSTSFAGLAEGDTVTADDGTQFRISYTGGDGNDVVLTQLNVIALAPPQFQAISRDNGGAIQLDALGTPNVPYRVLATTNLAGANWVDLGLVAADGLGMIYFTDSEAPTLATRFYRLVRP